MAQSWVNNLTETCTRLQNELRDMTWTLIKYACPLRKLYAAQKPFDNLSTFLVAESTSDTFLSTLIDLTNFEETKKEKESQTLARQVKKMAGLKLTVNLTVTSILWCVYVCDKLSVESFKSELDLGYFVSLLFATDFALGQIRQTKGKSDSKGGKK